MKKFFLALVFVAASVALYANPICYFTYSQARRTVHFLNTQDELVIYCGHQYELETYVIVSDIWMERVNSRYYEVWLYGIDAYTGEEIFMPIDLSCIWLLDRWTNSMYSAARYLHFQIDAPYTTLVWTMPTYTGFVRVAHPAYYRRSYHYDIHRHGWRPMPDAGLPVYYMRPPTAPMPVVVNPYVPGRERPTVRVDNTLQSRPQPTTSRTTSTPVRNVNPTPTNTNNSNRHTSSPAVNNGGNNHDTRNNGSSQRNTSSSTNSGTTGRTPSTSTNNNMNPTPTPGSNTGRTPSTTTTRPTSNTTTGRPTTIQPRTSTEKPASTTTATPSRSTSQQRPTSTNTRSVNNTPKATTTSGSRSTPSSTSGKSNTNNTNNGKATSTTTRTSSSSRR